MILEILLSIILPVFIIITVGFVAGRLFKLDIDTLSKLNFYIFVPALIFIKLIKVEIPFDMFFTVGAFTIAHFIIMLIIAFTLTAIKSLRDKRVIILLSSVFSNTGNYGIPLIIFAFGEKYIGIIAIIIVILNFFTFTLGLRIIDKNRKGIFDLLINFLKVPVVYAVVFGMIIRFLNLSIPQNIYMPLNYISDGLIPVALITLGVQLSRLRMFSGIIPISVISIIRLAVSPLVAFILVYVFNFDKITGSVLITACATPVAVNVFILAVEYDNNKELASQAIFFTTIVSAFTVSIILALLK